MVETTDEASADLLYGVPSIARFLGMREKQARHRIDAGTIPTFRLDGSRGTICARKSTLRAWLSDREAAARRSGPDSGDAASEQVPAPGQPERSK